MTQEKFESETKILQKFIETYCLNKHQNQKQIVKNLFYKKNLNIELQLCEDCIEMFDYSVERLYQCPHQEKPKCRRCQNPCYEKSRWKKLAKVMRYSGLKLGFLKIKDKFFS